MSVCQLLNGYLYLDLLVNLDLLMTNSYVILFVFIPNIMSIVIILWNS